MDVYDDMPPLVEAGTNFQPHIPPPHGARFTAGHPTTHNMQNIPPPQGAAFMAGHPMPHNMQNIPPPQGAAFMAGHPMPHNMQNIPPQQGAAFMAGHPMPHNMQNMPPQQGATFMAGHPTLHHMHAGWNPNMHQPYPFPTQAAPREQWPTQYQHWQGAAPPGPLSMPSPYIPHGLPPETWGNPRPGPLRRTNSHPAAFPSNAQQRAQQWNAWEPRPLHNHAQIYPPPTPHSSAISHTPRSTVSLNRSLSASYVPPDWPGERPKSWRRDFKFKSGFSSLFRTRSIPRLDGEL
jgi:hypothetical protein